ncbi:DNA-3-methyladenine glycosylase I [Frateuria sp. GZRR35]|uniref:DNA-3-methyladenine glycosylase I n=1 Tax=Frateuria sp. GZRR35 TaxID=3351536 RepID=UPI003EDBFDC2
MTLPVVEGWNPLGGQPARSDDEIFELLTAAVFQARFRPAVVRARWPAIRHAFADFALATVAAWPDDRLDDLLAAEGMIRNPKKIRATLRNARDLQARSRQFGTAAAYLQSFGGDGEAMVRDVDTWAHYIGAPSIRWFVRALAGGDVQ